ncbi:GNAT family N-acetyltransferase [uncultured Mailhella sp.]|uniref:GNAT family N-acetyltransferase n=1 Tax=uncultured Mailhella sp. TaxID=1981031 RepID=UPI0025DB9EC4|nr:GNAT family N-acetyltransferase [uncultured Mailhella sp.]
MIIRRIEHRKKRFLPLLLEADEQVNMIERYLERGELFVAFDDKENPQAVAVVTKEDDGLYELKNIAVAPELRRRGLGRELLDFLLNRYRGNGIMQVGTGDSPATLGFYRACGFTFSHVEKDFFVKNYDHPIVEDGKALRDMIYLRRQLPN